eukprot:285033_1
MSHTPWDLWNKSKPTDSIHNIQYEFLSTNQLIGYGDPIENSLNLILKSNILIEGTAYSFQLTIYQNDITKDTLEDNKVIAYGLASVIDMHVLKNSIINDASFEINANHRKKNNNHVFDGSKKIVCGINTTETTLVNILESNRLDTDCDEEGILSTDSISMTMLSNTNNNYLTRYDCDFDITDCDFDAIETIWKTNGCIPIYDEINNKIIQLHFQLHIIF